jgi:hypothetical protein
MTLRTKGERGDQCNFIKYPAMFWVESADVRRMVSGAAKR